MLSTQEKTEVSFTKSYEFMESYNSAFRVTVSNLVNEKYARKLIQEKLKEAGVHGANVTKLYEDYNCVKSDQGDHWVFGIQLPQNPFTLEDNYRRLFEVSEDLDG